LLKGEKIISENINFEKIKDVDKGGGKLLKDK